MVDKATEQVFHHGDLVRIAKDLGPSMAHFPADCDAIVVGSYADQYGGDDHGSLTLYVKDRGGENSWYDTRQLTLIEKGRADLLATWRAEAQAEREQKGDLDWIFAHGTDVLSGAHGATLEALAAGLGIGNLWGSQGHGFTYYRNAKRVLALAVPFLLRGDKKGWLAYCAARKESGVVIL